MIEVVAFVGVIGSGKDYQANLLVDKGFVRIDFKDELLDMVSDLVGYNVRDDYDWFKEHVVGIRRPENRLLEYHAHNDSELARVRGAMTGRQMLQRFGTEVMRKRDPDYWAKAWHRRAMVAIHQGKSVTCADCRFMNEVGHVNKTRVPAKFIFCDYHSSRYDAKSKHVSERMAQDLLFGGLKDMEEITIYQFLEIPRRLMGVS